MKAYVKKLGDKWVVIVDDQQLGEPLHSEQAARTAAEALNYDPGKNPFDHFVKGRWTK